MRDSPTSARPLLSIELERCIDRMEKCQVCRSEFCLRDIKHLLFKVDALYFKAKLEYQNDST